MRGYDRERNDEVYVAWGVALTSILALRTVNAPKQLAPSPIPYASSFVGVAAAYNTSPPALEKVPRGKPLVVGGPIPLTQSFPYPQSQSYLNVHTERIALMGDDFKPCRVALVRVVSDGIELLCRHDRVLEKR